MLVAVVQKDQEKLARRIACVFTTFYNTDKPLLCSSVETAVTLTANTVATTLPVGLATMTVAAAVMASGTQFVMLVLA